MADFVPGSLTILDELISMDGISGLLVDTQRGRVKYEVINNGGGMYILECEGYLLMDLMAILFSPQVFVQEPHQRGGTYTLTWYGFVLILKNSDLIPIGYHCQNSLPVLCSFSNTMMTEKLLVCVTYNNNINCSSHEKNIFSWYTRWGSLGLQHFQFIVWASINGNIVISF